MARNTPCRDWLAVQIASTNHQAIAKKIGRKLFPSAFGGGLINYPTAIAFDEGKLAVINYAGSAYRFSADWAIDFAYPIANEAPTDTNSGINSSFGIDFQDNKIAIASWTYNLVRVYNKVTGVKLFQIGLYNDLGNVADDKLNRPSKILWLENGNLLVVSHQGRGLSANGDGHLSEYDGTNGSFIATRLGYYGDGISKIGSNICYRPFDAKFFDGFLWVTEYGRNKILKIDPLTWLIVDIYYAPNGASINAPRALAVTEEGVLVVAAIDGNLVGIDLDSRGLAWQLDPTKLGASGDFRDLVELESGYLAFTDWGTRSLFVASISTQVAIAFSPIVLPEGFEIAKEYLPKGFNISNSLLSIDIDCLDSCPSLLVIPLRAKCDNG